MERNSKLSTNLANEKYEKNCIEHDSNGKYSSKIQNNYVKFAFDDVRSRQ